MSKRTILFSAIIIIVSISSYLLYNRISNPAYSLNQIKTAFEEHDLTKFTKYVDYESIMAGVMEKTLQELEEENEDLSGAEKLGSKLGTGIASLMRTQIYDIWKQQLNRLVETGDIEYTGNKIGLEDLWYKNQGAKVEGLGEINIDGKVADVPILFNYSRFDTTLALTVKMRDKGMYWQLFDIIDLYRFFGQIDSLEKERVKKVNELVVDSFYNCIEISEIKVRSRSHGYYYKYYDHTYYIKLKNIGSTGINRINVSMTLRNNEGDLLEFIRINEKVDLSPSQVYDHYYYENYSRYSIDNSDLKHSINSVILKFSDGSKLEWVYPWSDLKENL